MKVARQAVLPFDRKARVENRKLAQRMAGVCVQRGPGRPPLKNGRVKHRVRPVLTSASAVHVTLKLRAGMPSLRHKTVFASVRTAFLKFASLDGFRLIHFAVMHNHIHLLVEADSSAALSLGMRKVGHSISRRLNALAVRAGKGWLGRVFADRYFMHVLKTPTEMKNALRYLFTQMQHHTSNRRVATAVADACSSFVASITKLLPMPHSYLMRRFCT